MLHIRVFSIIMFTNISLLYSQSAEDYYVSGVVEFQKNNLRKADSLFTLSIDSHPRQDSYYNRGIVRKMMSDSCHYCNDMLTGIIFFNDHEAVLNFQKDCVREIDTTFLTSKYLVVKKAKYRYYDVLLKRKCADVVTGIIFDAKMKYSAFGHPPTSKPIILGLTLFKTSILAEYYMKGSEKIYLSLNIDDKPEFIGENQNQIQQQLRQMISSVKPGLKDI